MARPLRTGRLEAFSDGVFAIAITLLVLELSVPTDVRDGLLHAIAEQWPSYLAYVISFAAIGATWLAHTGITHHLRAMDPGLVRLNLLVLLLVSLMPFTTALTAAHIRDEGAERVAVVVFGCNLVLVAAAVSSLWRYALRRGLVDPDLDDEEVRGLMTRLTPGVAGYVGLILLGLALPRLAVFGYLALSLALLVPVGLRGEWPTRPPGSE